MLARRLCIEREPRFMSVRRPVFESFDDEPLSRFVERHYLLSEPLDSLDATPDVQDEPLFVSSKLLCRLPRRHDAS